MLAIAAGIVTYNPEIERLQENIKAILPQVDYLIIVDNASQNKADWIEIVHAIEKVTIIENIENKGIATALNQIVEKSMSLGCQWSLTLDDDSVVPSDMIEKYQCYVDMDKVAMIVPIIHDRTMSVIDVSGKITQEYEYVDTAISSGTLMNNKIWKEIDGFTEQLFIDYVDLDYCMKVKIAGYKILRINTVQLLHELGNATEIKLFTWLSRIFSWKPSISKKFGDMRYTTNHSPNRLYYLTRNQFYYMNEYSQYIDAKQMKKGMKIGWIVKLIFEKNRIAKFKAIKNGIKDGKRMVKERNNRLW